MFKKILVVLFLSVYLINVARSDDDAAPLESDSAKSSEELGLKELFEESEVSEDSKQPAKETIEGSETTSDDEVESAEEDTGDEPVNKENKSVYPKKYSKATNIKKASVVGAVEQHNDNSTDAAQENLEKSTSGIIF